MKDYGSNPKMDIGEAEISDSYYSLRPWRRIYWIGFGIFCLLVGFFANISLDQKIKTLISVKLKENVTCPVGYRDLDVSLLLPRIIFTDLFIPGECLGPGTTETVKIKKLNLDFKGMAFYPFGLKWSLKGLMDDSVVALDTVLSLKESLVKIDNTKIALGNILRLYPSMPHVAGDLLITSFFRYQSSKKNMRDFNIHIRSSDLNLLSQRMSGIDLPNIALGALSLKIAQVSSKRFNILELILGANDQSPVWARFSGVIDLFSNDYMNSALDLRGEVKFSTKFLSEFPILTLLMKRFEMRDGFHQIKVTGTLGNPSFNP